MRAGTRQTTLTGVVLHLSDFGESHRVIELLSEEEGKVALVARGARASRHRFRGALDLFVGLKVAATVRPGLWSLEAADVQTPRLGIREGLDRLERATILVDVVRALTPEHQHAREMYEALKAGLDQLARGESSQAALAYPVLLRVAGLAPQVSRCGRCGCRTPDPVALEPSAGVLVCARCATGLPLMPASTWRGDTDLEVKPEVAWALEKSVAILVEFHLGRALKSVRAFRSKSGL